MAWVRGAGVALLAVVLAHAQRPSGPPPPAGTPGKQAERLTRQLELPERCSAAWRGLLAIGPPAARPLAAATADPRPEVAVVACWVLGLLGADGEAALPELRTIAAGTREPVATAARWAVDRIGFRGRLLADYQEGTVVHLDPLGGVVRRLDGLAGPWHAEPSGDGRLLVSEYNGNRVRELDAAGKEVWVFAESRNPYHAQRLPNGNTLVSDAGNDRVVEVDRAGKIVWEMANLKRPVAAVRTPDGHTLVSEQRGAVFELDAGGREIWRTEVLKCAMRAERLPNGNTLVAIHDGGEVIEFGPDAKGIGAPFALPTAQAALRRRDGHTLMAATSCWLELDADGKEVWRRPAKYAVGVHW